MPSSFGDGIDISIQVRRIFLVYLLHSIKNTVRTVTGIPAQGRVLSFE